MDWMESVRALWEAYVAKAEQLERDKKPGAGLLGLTPGPKDDPCHGQFMADAEKLLTDMLVSEPGSGEVREVLSYIYRAPLEHRQPLTAYWSLQAVHALTVPLVGRLSREDAGALQDQFSRDYRRWERLPAQRDVLAALERARR